MTSFGVLERCYMEKEIRIVLGIDIGGTYTKLGLVTRKGELLATNKFATMAKEPFANFLDRLKREINVLKSKLQTAQEISHVGVGAPNVNPYSGNMENPVNFRWGTSIPLSKSIQEIIPLPITLANDANAAAMGELEFGMGKGMRHFVVLTLGTGLGSGIISNGDLLIGKNGMAGEIGHVNVVPQGRECNCGLKGCLETYVSVTGMRRTIFELIAEMTADSPLRGVSFEDMTGKMLSQAALDGDPIALKAFAQTAEILGCQMADTAAHLDPEAFILLGGLSQAGDILLKPVIQAMEHNLFSAYKGKIKVLISDTTSERSVLGPAALAFQKT